MRNIMFTFLTLVLSATMVSAATVVTTTYGVVLNEEKVKISPDELPDAIKTALSAENYAGWEISAAYKYTEKDLFEVELKSGEEVTTVKFDKTGKKVD